LKFIIEGEEEIGSGNLDEFVNKNQELLKCDTVMISDTSLYGPGIPTLTYGLRGLCYMEVVVTGPNRDLHSGTFGGGVDNPINVLAEMISKRKDSNGKIYARGATDDKGQMYMHIKSVEAYFKTIGKLPVNLKFIIEGEEEIGSGNLDEFVNKNQEMLKCDSVLISDTSLYGPGIPTLTYGLRGLCYMEVVVTGPNRDLHSGTFGGGVDNPINVLAEMISKLKDSNGKIKIPGFYKDVVNLTKKERENFKRLPFSEKQYAKALDVKALNGEKGYTTLERVWARPTLDCNGIFGGFTGEGAKTVLPSKATAKISMRLVPNQDPKKIAKLFKSYINKIAPKTVKVEISDLHGAYPIATSLDDKATLSAARALAKVFGKKTIFMREGGSIPIVVSFAKKLKAAPVLMGMGLNTENLHSPNEHFNLNHFHLGILSSAYFLDEYSK
jgi:acetylornithine deacetylase/succinyl-diaminopimelate desuccinylase-like protein